MTATCGDWSVAGVVVVTNVFAVVAIDWSGVGDGVTCLYLYIPVSIPGDIDLETLYLHRQRWVAVTS